VESELKNTCVFDGFGFRFGFGFVGAFGFGGAFGCGFFGSGLVVLAINWRP
jgi:hypothetical protein